MRSLATGEREVVLQNAGTDVTYLPTGHLAYLVDGTLMVVAFDSARRVVTGDAVPVVERVRDSVNGVAQLAYANGALVYQRGDPPSAGLHTGSPSYLPP